MESKRPYDALIIGAGIGGLSAGIILSLLGFRVAVIEKNPLPGGMMRGYRRGGMDCPVGVHYFGSFGEGEPLRRVCDFLGVTERMSVERMGQDGPIDRYLFDDFTFDLPEGVDAFAASLGRAFPDEGQAIARIAGNLRATLDVQNSFAFFSPAPPLLDSKLYAPLGAYLAGMNCSAGLRNVLGVAARWMGMSDSDCPVFYHHFALASYLLSSWRLKGSGAELAEAFVSRFEELGGTLICGDAVTAILPPGAGAAVGGVRLASGRVLDGSRLVAAIHPKKVIGMLPEGAVKPRHARLVGQLAETEGLFALNAAVDAAAHPALPYNLFRLHADREGTVKDGAFYQLRDGREGKNLLVIITKSPYPEWSRWEDTRSGSRGAAYAEAKADRAGRLLRDAEGIFGPLAGAKILDAYTPLSLRDWVGSPDGSPYGIMRSIHQLPAVAVLSRLAPAGLFFAGQSALSPGILGTLLGSLQVARQVLGPDRFASEVFERLTRGRQERGPDMNDTKTGDELRTAVSSGRIRLRDFAVTVVLWAYYIMGFILFFSPFYLCALVSSAPREEAFQRLNHRLHRSFFTLLRTLTPRTKWRIADEVRDIRSSVIIANHLSFLDPILFVSLFEKQKTIAKNDYFHLPVFGWILRTSGYIPSQAGGQFAADMVDQVKKMREYLQGGGNLFIFPEGHRSRDGRIGTFDQGAFKIARLCRAASIKVVLIRNTGRLFPPGGFLFDTRDETVIDVELAGSLEPDYESEAFSLAALMAEARRLMEKRMCEGQPRLSAGSDPSAGAASRKSGLDLDENNDYNPPVNGSSEYPLR